MNNKKESIIKQNIIESVIENNVDLLLYLYNKYGDNYNNDSYDNGLDFNIRDSKGDTLFHIAINNKSYDIMPYLLDCNVSPYIIDDIYEEEPIIYAIIKNDIYAVDKLLNTCNIYINHHDYKKDTLLHLCIYNENERMIKYLIKKGININIVNSSGNTALLESISDTYCSEKISKLLISLKADVNMRNYETISPIYMALINNKYAIFDQILTHQHFVLTTNDKYKILSYCLKNKCINYLELLLMRNKLSENEINDLIFISIRRNYITLIEAISIIRYDFNLYDKNGKTPKSLAKLYKRYKILDIIKNV